MTCFSHIRWVGAAAIWLALCACDAGPARPARTRSSRANTCSSARDCDTDSPRTCSLVTRRCTPILSQDCGLVSGPYDDERALWIGSLLALQGAQAASNRARQQAAQLAVERANAAGGIPSAGSDEPRPLVMVSCDASADVIRAANHLVRDLGAIGIVGPDTSQDTLDLAQHYAIDAGTFLISPTAMASDIAHLLDDDLVFQMVPHAEQRAAWMIWQIEQLAARVSRQRGGAPLKLGLLYRDDAWGSGVRVELSSLEWNGKPLADPENLGNLVYIDAYDPARADQAALVEKYQAFGPDVLVMAGTAEVVTQFMAPLERAAVTTHYVLTDAAKVPELLELARADESVRTRVHGTGVAPSPEARSVNEAFLEAFRERFPDAPASISGVAAAYDATSALALGLAAAGAAGGRAIARGLRALGAGVASQHASTDRLAEALAAAMSGEPLDVLGTLGPLRWDDDGALLEASLESWCIGLDAGDPSFWSSGASFDVRTQAIRGQAERCGEQVEVTKPPTSPTSSGSAPRESADAGAPAAMSGAGAAPPADPDPPDAAGESSDAAVPDAGPPPPAAGASRPIEMLSISVLRDTSWQNGYCSRVTVRNEDARAGTWEVELLVAGRLSDHWSCNVSSERGLVVFSGVDWNRTLDAGGSTEFGFCVAR